MQKPTTLMSQECTTKQIYLESIDAVIATIKNPFNQVDYEVYAKHEQVLLLAATKSCYSSKLRRLWTFTEMILASQTLKLSWRCSVERKLNVPVTQLCSRVFTTVSVMSKTQWSPIKSSCAFKHESTHLKMTCFLFDESVTSSDSSTKNRTNWQ